MLNNQTKPEESVNALPQQPVDDQIQPVELTDEDKVRFYISHNVGDCY